MAMASTRINARLSHPLAQFVQQMVGPMGLYETPSEYIRDLIRRDMEQHQSRIVSEAILDGYRDLAEGAYFTSTGDFEQDMAVLEQKEAYGWR
jgi:antitoxin ParD1/3/4